MSILSMPPIRRLDDRRRRNAIVDSEYASDLHPHQTPPVTATMRQTLLFEQKVEEMKPSKR